ncbi:MAG: hypothetical protein ABIL25_00210 [candidate division WOR-3 bacterium]
MATLSAVLDWHFARYPLLQASDIYKLVHQGVFGPGHLLMDTDGQSLVHGRASESAQARMHADVRRGLEEELVRLSSRGSASEETEPLDPDGRLIRVNLAWLRRDTDAILRLTHAVVQTCLIVKPDLQMTNRRLSEAVAWCGRNIPDQVVWLEEMAEAGAKENYPPVHHSRVYATAYHPAYRVVRQDFWTPRRRGSPAGP